MSASTIKGRQRANRQSRGAIYTVCFTSLIVPFVLALGNTIMQAALCYYNQDRMNFVGNDVIEHFDSLADLDEKKFDELYAVLAAANTLRVKNVKSHISMCTDTPEETVQIAVSGRYDNDLGLFTWNRPFQKVYRIKCSQFDTFAYLAINGYPYCQFDTTQGLSDYLPLYRPSATSPTWQFNQDSAIGGVRKAFYATTNYDDQKPANWKQLAEGLTSIY